VIPMEYTREWLVDALRRSGYQQEADEALRVLPEEFDLNQLEEFSAKYGFNREVLTDRMGGSP
jgi:hypothetical protein